MSIHEHIPPYRSASRSDISIGVAVNLSVFVVVDVAVVVEATEV